jgi:putative ABC transport system permease protein
MRTPRLRVLLAEAAAMARTQRVISAITALLAGASCLAVLATTGQTVVAERQILSRVDEETSRLVVVTARDGDAGLDSTVVDHAGRLSAVEWAVGLGFARDARNVAIPGGHSIPVRTIHGDPSRVGGLSLSRTDLPGGEVLVAEGSRRTLGMVVAAGGLEFPDGQTAPVVGRLDASGPLGFLDDGALMMPPPGAALPVRSLYLMVDFPHNIAPTTSAVEQLLSELDTGAVTIQTGEALADLRRVLAGDFGRFGRGLVALILSVTGLLLAVAVSAAVALRRKEFGLYRVLGAHRSHLMLLVLLRTALPATAGAALGLGAGTTLLLRWTHTWPDPAFVAALGVLTVAVALVAILPPAILAAFRDPVSALRVP